MKTRPILKKISGKIEKYTSRRLEASFVFTNADRETMGVIAVAASIAGLSGQAIATASAVASVTEDADYVEFELNGEPIKGWLWRSPFKDGDEVDVAAEWRGDHYELGGVVRPADHTIALYPHCSRGRRRHIKNAIKWWFIIATVFVAIAAVYPVFTDDGLVISEKFLRPYYLTALGGYAFFGLMIFSLARKWMPFVLLTEKLCRTLGLSNPGDVDLVASSKRQRRGEDPGEFGTFYFRY